MDGISVQNSDQKAKLGQLEGCSPVDQRDFKASPFNRNSFFISSHPSCRGLDRESGRIDRALF